MPMRCEQAFELFDAYLDGELSSTMASELDAHRVQCAECRRRLALLEVSEHIVSSDRDPVALRADFTDRLIACMETAPLPVGLRVRRWVYVAAPLAAAAVVGLALLGLFDHRPRGVTAGVTVEMDDLDVMAVPAVEAAPGTSVDPADTAFEAWYSLLRVRLESKRQSVESLQQAIDIIAPAQPAGEAGQQAESLEETPADESDLHEEFLDEEEPGDTEDVEDL